MSANVYNRITSPRSHRNRKVPKLSAKYTPPSSPVKSFPNLLPIIERLKFESMTLLDPIEENVEHEEINTNFEEHEERKAVIRKRISSINESVLKRANSVEPPTKEAVIRRSLSHSSVGRKTQISGPTPGKLHLPIEKVRPCTPKGKPTKPTIKPVRPIRPVRPVGPIRRASSIDYKGHSRKSISVMKHKERMGLN